MFDERNNAEYAIGLSATLSGTTAAKGNIVDLIFSGYFLK